jgi:NADPH-dependent 2,4-dienoyl-CoA reductase/sulfur reductase-like enzyme/Fe-S-cluster-containing hydrogenase component 2/bacterioferritin-associated ferredoxin
VLLSAGYRGAASGEGRKRRLAGHDEEPVLATNETRRISRHPILKVAGEPSVTFFFDGRELLAREGEMISSALIAHGLDVFGHHSKDSSPQGIFCANGQCAQCLVIAEGVPVKGCMTPVREGMHVVSCDRVPELPEADHPASGFGEVRTIKIDVLVIGGGPSGITAALELASHGTGVLLVDDKNRLGGKLVLQTHSFFGTVADCYAGTRGTDIAERLAGEVAGQDNVRVMLGTTAVACYADGRIGLVRDGEYILVEPEKVLIASGAREKALSFPGCDLPGVYGAGAFQTLVNRDLVRPSERLFVVGGGNVGLIAAYHAVQAGIGVVGLVEAMPEIGGYKVHQDKIKRLGIPVWTSHTVLRADGENGVESVTVAEVDTGFSPIPGTERTYKADTLLIAVGLNPVDELFEQAQRFGMDVCSAGDALEIAEASAAIFSGRIAGRRIARDLGRDTEIPAEWEERLNVLKSKPGRTVPLKVEAPESGLYPVIRCVQEIPCDPCIHVCPKDIIHMRGDPVFGIPEVTEDACTGCTMCVAACPGLAITLVDVRGEGGTGLVTVPFELLADQVTEGAEVDAVGMDGEPVCRALVKKVSRRRGYDRTILVTLEVPKEEAAGVTGFRVQDPALSRPVDPPSGEATDEETIVCRCERVTAGEIRRMIRRGVRDLNQLKVLRCGMGACGGKTCESLILKLFKEEGVDLCDVVPFSKRPLVSEVELGVLSAEKGKGRSR